MRQLPDHPDVLVVNGTGLDHPRHAGMALHLGYLLDLPTVGVTHRPLCAEGSWPDDEMVSISLLAHDGQIVGYWVRTRYGARPLVAHGAWRTSPKQPQRLSLLLRLVSGLPNRFAWPVKWPARPGQVLNRWSNFGDAYEIPRSYTGPFTKYLS